MIAPESKRRVSFVTVGQPDLAAPARRNQLHAALDAIELLELLAEHVQHLVEAGFLGLAAFGFGHGFRPPFQAQHHRRFS